MGSPTLFQNTSAGGGSGSGGGSSIVWIEGDSSAISYLENNQQVYLYEAGQTQYLFCAIKVPSSYTVGSQINMRSEFYSPDTSGTVLLQTLSTLIRTGTDDITSTTNQRTSTNAAVTLSGASNLARSVVFDLSASNGTINSVGINGGDIILVRLTRGSDSATSDVRTLVYGTEVTFS